MRKTAFNRKITLFEFTPQSGFSEPIETARANVWADVSEPGATIKFAALQTGQTVSLSVVMWRCEFKSLFSISPRTSHLHLFRHT